MDARHPNLFLCDRTFRQKWTLDFRQKSTERKFQIESGYNFSRSIFYLWVFICAAWSLYTYTLYSPVFFLISIFVLLSSKYISVFFPARILIQIYVTIWECNSLMDASMIECLGTFMPSLVLNFYLSKTWTVFCLYLIFQVLFLTFYTNTNFIYLIISGCVCTLLSYFFEKDYRDLWHLYSSYKKSNCLHQNLWNNCPFSNFIIDSQGYIIHTNTSADKFMSSKVKTPKPSHSRFDMFFSESKEECKKLIEKSKKTSNEEEFLLKRQTKKISKISLENIGHLVLCQNVTWNSSNSTRAICIDFSMYLAHEMMIINSFALLQEHLEPFKTSLLGIYLQQDVLTPELLTEFYKIDQMTRDIMVLQSHFLNKFDKRHEHFDVHAEILNLIEIMYLKACENNVNFLYTKEQGVPLSVIGDKYLHNQILFSILNVILNTALNGSDVCILLQVSSLVKYDITLNYKLTFKSSRITNVDISSMFMGQSFFWSKEVVEEKIKSLYTFGMGVAAANSTLLYLKGQIVKVHSENDHNKVTINLTIPFNTGKRKVSSSLIHISQTSTQETPLTTRWKPGQPVTRSSSMINNISSSDVQQTSSCEIVPCDFFSISNVSSRNQTLRSNFTIQDIVLESSLDEETFNFSEIQEEKTENTISNTQISQDSELHIKKSILIFTKSPNLKIELLSHPDLIVKTADSVGSGLRIFDNFFDYSARFSAILVDFNEEDSLYIQDYIKDTECLCFYQTPICYSVKDLYKELMISL